MTSSTRALWPLPLWEWCGERSRACEMIGRTEGSAAAAAWRPLLCPDAMAWDRKDNDRKIKEASFLNTVRPSSAPRNNEGRHGECCCEG